MGVYKQKKSKFWWYKFRWNGELIRESAKQTNKRTAETMEAAHRTALAKGEVGIRERKRIPSLSEFTEVDFRPFARSHFADKPKTLEYYLNGAKNLLAHRALATKRLDAINADDVGKYVAARREAGLKVSSINRELEVLRRMLRLASESGRVERCVRVQMLPGEVQRDLVLSADEEERYMTAASQLGQQIDEEYRQALKGVRATSRGQQPKKPDAFLLRDITTILLDCGLCPDECFRPKWSEIRDGALHIAYGKTLKCTSKRADVNA